MSTEELLVTELEAMTTRLGILLPNVQGTNVGIPKSSFEAREKKKRIAAKKAELACKPQTVDMDCNSKYDKMNAKMQKRRDPDEVELAWGGADESGWQAWEAEPDKSRKSTHRKGGSGNYRYKYPGKGKGKGTGSTAAAKAGMRGRAQAARAKREGKVGDGQNDLKQHKKREAVAKKSGQDARKDVAKLQKAANEPLHPKKANAVQRALEDAKNREGAASDAEFENDRAGDSVQAEQPDRAMDMILNPEELPLEEGSIEKAKKLAAIAEGKYNKLEKMISQAGDAGIIKDLDKKQDAWFKAWMGWTGEATRVEKSLAKNQTEWGSDSLFSHGRKKRGSRINRVRNAPRSSSRGVRGVRRTRKERIRKD